MSSQDQSFNRGVIGPVECYQEGWALIKSDYWLFLGITLVGMLIGGAVPFGIVLGPMMCGIHMTLQAKMRNEEVRFDMLFKGFDHFVPSLVATLIQIVPIVVVLVPLYVVMALAVVFLKQGQGDNGMVVLVIVMIVVLVVVVLSIFFSMLMMFCYPLIVDRNLSGLDACKLSAKAVMGNLGGMIALMLLSMAVNLLGALACYIGAIFVIPIYMAACAVAYKKLFGLRAPQQPPMAPYFAPPPVG